MGAMPLIRFQIVDGAVALAVILSCPIVSAEEADWRLHTNARFGVSVEYPSAFVADGSALGLTDGQPSAATRPPTGVNLSSNDGVEIRIYGMATGVTPYSQMCAAGCAGETYTVKRPDVAVVSGLRSEFLYYRRCRRALDNRSQHCFDLEYPDAKRAAMVPVIERMSRTLR